jgi:hypothetical protein
MEPPRPQQTSKSNTICQTISEMSDIDLLSRLNSIRLSKDLIDHAQECDVCAARLELVLMRTGDDLT